MRLLIDMDGVCADLLPYWLERINNDYGTHLIPDDIVDWEVSNCCDLGPVVDKYFEEPGFFYQLKPVPGAIKTLKKLWEEGHDIVFVTAAQSGHKDKREWLTKYFPFIPLKNLIFAERKELVIGDVLFDDKVANLDAFPNYKICMAAPYNRDYTGYRVKRWKDFYSLIEKLSLEREGASV